MEENQVSKSALITAFSRGYHAKYDSPKVFNDFIVYDLFTEKERASMIKTVLQIGKVLDPAYAATFTDEDSALAWSMQQGSIVSLTVSRSRFTEDTLLEAIKKGVQQYVILGAGMDTFAFRHSELQERLQVFEVDHPVTQEYKCQRITELGWKTPSNLNFIPVDFTKENLKTALSHSSYDPKALTFFSLLGVTYYLHREALFTTLRTIAKISPSGSSIVFDYFSTEKFAPDKESESNKQVIQGAQKSGEPLKSIFDPSTLADDIAILGLSLHENLSPTEIKENYFLGRLDNYNATEHAYFALALVE